MIGDRFPYTNFHELNQDWIIKVIKDFMDDYKNIEQTVTDGTAAIQEAADTALTDFSSAAEQKAAETIASIPADYTEVAAEALKALQLDTSLSPVAIITASVDLNNYLTPGNYKVLSTVTAQTISNIPEATPGRLFVMTIHRADRVVQIYQASNANVYMRAYEGMWYPWKTLATEYDRTANVLLNGLDPAVIQLEAGADLNDITTVGNYRIRNTPTASSILNMPEAVPGRLFVLSMYRDDRLIQVYIAMDGNMFIRTYEGTWSSWTKFSTDSIPTYQTITDMVNNFTYKNAVCYVVSDSSNYADSYKGNYYRYSSAQKYGDIVLAGGGSAVLINGAFTPIKGSNTECIPTLIDLVESYMNVGVEYKANNGPFMLDAENRTGIQCSQFVCCLLLGLYYENSKLEDETNTNELIEGGVTYLKPYIDVGALSANELAMFAAKHGWIHETDNFADCEPGDVCFFYLKDGTVHETGNWNAIAHCNMVITKKDGYVILAQAGSLTRFNHEKWETYKPNDPTDAVNYAVILDENDSFTDGVFGLYGFARFPLNYRTWSQDETDLYDAAIGSL